MQVLLDSANLAEIERLISSPAIAGVTTNPSLVAKEEKDDYYDLVKRIGDIVYGAGGERHLSVEVTTLNPTEMISQALKIKKACQRAFVKIPVMVETLPLINELRYHHGISVNATACMTALQAKLASDAGANVVSFFFNRMIDWNHRGDREGGQRPLGSCRTAALNEIAQYQQWRKPGSAYVICGSIRVDGDLTDCFNAGADYVTASAKIIEGIIRHPKTVESIEGFQRDIEKWQG